MCLRVTPANVSSFVVYQGATFCQPVQWQVGGVAVDFTNDIQLVRAYIRESYVSSPPLFELLSTSTTGPRIETTPLTGSIELIIPADVTAAMPIRAAKSFVWDLELVTNAGHTWSAGFQTTFGVSGTTAEEVVTQLARGIIKWAPEATR